MEDNRPDRNVYVDSISLIGVALLLERALGSHRGASDLATSEYVRMTEVPDQIDYGAITGQTIGRVTVAPAIIDLADLISRGEATRWPALYGAARADAAVCAAIIAAAPLGDVDCRDCATAWAEIAQAIRDSAASKLDAPLAATIFVGSPRDHTTPEIWLIDARQCLINCVAARERSSGSKVTGCTAVILTAVAGVIADGSSQLPP